MPGKKEGREKGGKNKRRKGYRGRVWNREAEGGGSATLRDSGSTQIRHKPNDSCPLPPVKQLQSSGSALVLPLSLPRLSRDGAASGENKGSSAELLGGGSSSPEEGRINMHGIAIHAHDIIKLVYRIRCH